jgi:metallo-beta-lactamase class B
MSNLATFGIVADFRTTVAILRTRGADVFVASHNDCVDPWRERTRQKAGAPDPFVDPDTPRAFVAASAADFERELAAQQAAAC